ncbi:cupin domain-containing protein [Rhizobium sullae]|nr:cupin domain-containing protein [Rhizobium sullae]
MRISAVTEAVTLCIFEQWVAPGSGTRTHTHPVEEVLTILEGQAEMWLDDERKTVSTGQSVIVPAGSWHGFRNTRKRDIAHAGHTGRANLRGATLPTEGSCRLSIITFSRQKSGVPAAIAAIHQPIKGRQLPTQTWSFNRAARDPETGRTSAPQHSRFPMSNMQFWENPIGNRFCEKQSPAGIRGSLRTALPRWTFPIGKAGMHDRHWTIASRFGILL